YGLQHHELPIGDVILVNNISREQRNYAFSALQRYLGVPIFRVAISPEFASETEGWEYRDFLSRGESERHEAFLRALERFLGDNLDVLPRRRRRVNAKRFAADDMAHFCSFVVNPKLVDAVVSYFHFFVIQGLPNSVPYLVKRISECGKRFIYVPTLNPDGTLPPDPADFDRRYTCVVQTGTWRECNTDLPVIRLLHG